MKPLKYLNKIIYSEYVRFVIKNLYTRTVKNKILFSFI